MIGFLLFATFSASAPLAQEPDTALRWRAALVYSVERHTRDRSAWHETAGILSRRFGAGTLVAEAGTVTRFDLTDERVALDGYSDVSGRSYAHVRLAVAPGARITARTDISGEYYHVVRGGWELAGGYRRMNFADDKVDIFSGGLGQYRGAWYLRALGTATPKAGKTGYSFTLFGRRYYDPPEEFVEVNGGLGEQVVTIGAGPTGPIVELRRTAYAAARWQRRVSGQWGLTVGANWTSDERSPARSGLVLGAFRRW